jgi:tRNA pseudouridine38-40 synthase
LVQKGLSVIACEEIDQDFHARYSATSREYHYNILNRVAPGVWNAKILHVAKSLNADAMREAAHYLVGTYDFSSFRDSQCQAKSPIKTLSRCDVERHGELITAYIKAPSFLHHQVRIMMGTLKAVGAGALSLNEFIKIRDKKDRTKAGVTAPPDGLTFAQVGY